MQLDLLFEDFPLTSALLSGGEFKPVYLSL